MKKIIATVICAFALFTLVHKTDTTNNASPNVSPKIQYMMTDPGGL
ncbi:hypothetical protein P5815_31575 [Bacillus cereus]|nr:hypothetical protein [Bacillus cereus]MCC2369447.1 hypothetical protein [Bacillus cereus]MCC2489917.1 hypothetical protein [Bacillus cereus]MDF9525040.1 hypothetical protein [Bacillus cereus]MDF9564779.1 hypothetical protein [Bacillus cereus]HDX9512063.1 hypothetical protein [Bacillus cereus]